MNLRTSFSSLCSHSVFIAENGSLFVWGYNGYGELGLGFVNVRTTANDAVAPALLTLPHPSEIVSLSCGNNHTLAVTEDGSLYGWGCNCFGNLGLGTKTKPVSLPRLNPTLANVARIFCGAQFSIALTRTGQMYSWGQNKGQLGLGHTGDVLTPTKVEFPGGPIADISCGQNHVITMTRDGTIYLWGCGQFGALGMLGGTSKNTPMKHPSLKNVVQVAAGGRHSMALMRGGELWGWGSNAKGELGVKDNNERYNPVLVMAGVKAVACGSQHTLALLEDGTLWTWGLNKCGLLGLGSATDGFNSPQMLSIPKSADIVSIGCCAEHSFAMTRGGKLYMWGLTARGRLGLGPSRKESMTPTELADFRWKRKSIPWSFARLLFMAHKSRRSLFSKLPKELLGVILYHFSWC